MKLRKFSSLVGLLALTLAVPACGDDDGADSTDTTEEEEDAGGGDTTEDTNDTDTTEETSESDTTEETSQSNTTEDAGDDTTEDTNDTDESDNGDAGESDTTGDDTNDQGDASDTTALTDAGEGTDSEDAGEVIPPPDCPKLADRTPVGVPHEITENTTWSCDNLYVLPQGQISVVVDATLTIEPGTQIIGETGAGLVIAANAKIDANGQSNAPIIFTSSKDVGLRQMGDWGGILLLGKAPINAPNSESVAEGVPPTEGYADYGGTEVAHDCGSMSYVRIEFAGFEVSVDNELNGLGVAGCGTETELHHIQAHKGSDDGFEFWGGAPTVHHLVSSQNDDDQLDWTEGFTSSIQFVVLQNGGDTAIEGDNSEVDPTNTPRTMPTLSNVTIAGGARAVGVLLRRGSWGKIYNSIITGVSVTPVDLRDDPTFAGTEDGSLTIENTLFFSNSPFLDGEDVSMPDNFDEEAFFTDSARNNIFDVDPNLVDPTNVTAPDFMPADDTVATGAINPPAGMVDTSANYLGAFEPGGEDWTAGWTAYPQD